jgi:hypothetical protein
MKSFCNLCGAVVDVPHGKGGAKVACPQCGQAFRVPEAFDFSEDEVLDVVAEWAGAGDSAADAPVDPTIQPGEMAEADLVWEAAKCTVPSDGDGRRRLVASFRFASLVRAKAFLKGLPFVRVVDDVTGQIAFPSRVGVDLGAFKGGEARVVLRGQFGEDEIEALSRDAPRHGAHLEGVGW